MNAQERWDKLTDARLKLKEVRRRMVATYDERLVEAIRELEEATRAVEEVEDDLHALVLGSPALDVDEAAERLAERGDF